jgi:predicted dehydrogenase
MIRAGLIGFGLGGRVFHAPLISSVAGMELAAVFERNSNKAAERYPGITTYRSLDDLLADSSLDLLVVTTPNGTHFELARQILGAGRNVVVDKPTALTSTEIAELIELAAARNVLLIPFHNRRWDGDFRTIAQLLREGTLGELVHFESTFDRWRPVPRAGATWKEDPANGGMLLDIGTHLADQALVLFGLPETVSAEVRRERPSEGSNDSFTVRLGYPGLEVVLSANVLSTLARPRFHLRGTTGNYWKWGLDPQEAALSKITRIEGEWGHEAESAWGTLDTERDGNRVNRPVATTPGDYRMFYEGVRDAILGKSEPPVSGISAWRAARVLEWAEQSSDLRRDVECDWSGEPGFPDDTNKKP